MIGIFIGRFQPFHLGHLKAIKYISERLDSLYIIILGEQDSSINPYSAEQREQMIKKSLAAEKIKKCRIICIKKAEAADGWLSAIRKHVPHFDVVFTRNKRVESCFKRNGFAVKHQPLFQPERFNATRIRRMIRENGPWQERVPAPAADVIRSACQAQKQQKVRDR